MIDSMPVSYPVFGMPVNTANGTLFQSPLGMGSKIAIEKTLAENLKAAADFQQVSIKALAGKAGIGNGTVGRLMLAQSSATIGSVEALADKLKLEPWQLLVPGLDPKNPPMLRTISDTEQALYSKIEDLFARLAEAEKPKKVRTPSK